MRFLKIIFFLICCSFTYALNAQEKAIINGFIKDYDNFIDTWTAGKYYPLWVMNVNDFSDKRVKWKIHFSNN